MNREQVILTELEEEAKQAKRGLHGDKKEEHVYKFNNPADTSEFLKTYKGQPVDGFIEQVRDGICCLYTDLRPN